jgi:hypothetical protein
MKHRLKERIKFPVYRFLISEQGKGKFKQPKKANRSTAVKFDCFVDPPRNYSPRGMCWICNEEETNLELGLIVWNFDLGIYVFKPSGLFGQPPSGQFDSDRLRAVADFMDKIIKARKEDAQ